MLGHAAAHWWWSFCPRVASRGSYLRDFSSRATLLKGHAARVSSVHKLIATANASRDYFHHAVESHTHHGMQYELSKTAPSTTPVSLGTMIGQARLLFAERQSISPTKAR
jgi:hypothetical protein